MRFRGRSLYLNRLIIGLLKQKVALWNINCHLETAIALPVSFTIGLANSKLVP
ncbi:MAG: hypothetical protein KME57_18475 [Scytonema hyalinum WJT4-NPBG1]|nr:hypothetical protein [Scytonema hyalinum WJT4-NPBG1]